MLTQCPLCARQLMVPPQAVGKKVRCPACQAEFTASETTANPAPEPMPPPPAVSPSRLEAPIPFAGDDEPPVASPPPPSPREPDDYPRPRRRNRGHDDPTEDYDDFGQSTKVARGQARARSAASWLIIGGVFTLVSSCFEIVRMMASPEFGPGPDEKAGRFFLVSCCLGLVVPMSIFMFVGAGNLRTQRSRGLVITGAVMGFIWGGLYLLVVLFHLFMMLLFNAQNQALVFFPRDTMYLEVIGFFMAVAAATFNFIGAVKAVVAINDPVLAKRFDEYLYRPY